MLGVDGERRALRSPDCRVFPSRFLWSGPQNKTMEHRQPDPAWQLDHARVREELGEVVAHRRRRRRRRRAQIDEEDAFQAGSYGWDRALESSLAVTSTIGTTRS